MVCPSGDTSTCIHVTSSVSKVMVSAVLRVKPSAGFAVSSCGWRSWPLALSVVEGLGEATNMAHRVRSTRDLFMRASIFPPMRILRGLLVAVTGAVMAVVQLSAVTRVPSADGQFWDIQDTSPWSQDSG